MVQKIKKRNHFISQTYLEKFLNDNNILYVYKKGKQFFKKGITKKNRSLIINGKEGLINIGTKSNLYIPEGTFSLDKNIFEDFFNDEFDSKYNEFIKNINRCPFLEIIKKYHEYIINLTSSTMCRTLHSKDEIEEIYKVNFQMRQKFESKNEKRIAFLKKEMVKKEPNIKEEEMDEIITDYFKRIKEGEFEIKIPRNRFIKDMFEKMINICQIISDMNIHILKNKTAFPFITSDNPVVYFVPPEKVNFYFSWKSLGGPYTELYFPLTKDTCILMTRRKERDSDYVNISQGILARTINYNIAYNSKNFIFSPDQNKFIDKFIERYIPYPFQMRVG